MYFSSHSSDKQYFSSQKIDENVVFLATTHYKSVLTRRELPCVVTRNETLSGYRYCIWIDNIFLPKNVQSGKSVYLIWNWIGFPLDDWIWWRWYDGEPTYWDLALGWLILLTFMIKNCQSGRFTYLIGNWVISWDSFDVWTVIWRWTYVLGFGIGLANISVHIYDDAYVLEFDYGKSMYWIWNWIRSYLLIFQGIHMFKNFEGVTSMYWIWNWIRS